MNTLFEFHDANVPGEIRVWTADDVRRLVANPDTNEQGAKVCRVCNFIAVGAGYGPHGQSHLRAIGDIPPRTASDKPKKAPKSKAGSVDEACYALLAHTVGDRIPISMIGDVAAWVESTKKLIGALK